MYHQTSMELGNLWGVMDFIRRDLWISPLPGKVHVMSIDQRNRWSLPRQLYLGQNCIYAPWVRTHQSPPWPRAEWQRVGGERRFQLINFPLSKNQRSIIIYTYSRKCTQYCFFLWSILFLTVVGRWLKMFHTQGMSFLCFFLSQEGFGKGYH